MVGEGSQMKINLLWWFDRAAWVWPNYRDGVKAAMEELERRGHAVKWCLGTEPQVDTDCDFILIWGDSRIPAFDYVKGHPAKKGLLLTTDLGMDIESLRNYDVVFAETQGIVDKIKPFGIRCIKAFGTDTDFFNPTNENKIYEAYYPATFSPWKRQNLFADRWGERGLCQGTIQPDGWDILKYTVEKKVNVFIGYAPVELVKSFYAKSKCVDITGWEGSGRTILEGLSMNLPVIASEDNHKCCEYIREWKDSKLEPREFAIKYYSHIVYADSILKGAE